MSKLGSKGYRICGRRNPPDGKCKFCNEKCLGYCCDDCAEKLLDGDLDKED